MVVTAWRQLLPTTAYGIASQWDLLGDDGITLSARLGRSSMTTPIVFGPKLGPSKAILRPVLVYAAGPITMDREVMQNVIC